MRLKVVLTKGRKATEAGFSGVVATLAGGLVSSSSPLDPAVIELVNEAMRAYEYAPASEPNLARLSEVLQSIRGLKVGKAPGPNGTEQGIETCT
jgi:hypothetical protein